MKSVRIKNLRSLSDTNEIKLKPLTILVGKNGSGKSTLARLFPLLRQSVEVNTRGPILWYGKHVDYGSFKESVNNANKRSPISIKFGFDFLAADVNLDVFPRLYFGPSRTEILDDIHTEIEFNISMNEKDDKTYVSKLLLDINDDVVDICISEDGNVTNFRVNDTDILSKAGDYSVWQLNELIPVIKPIALIKDSAKSATHVSRMLRYGMDSHIVEAVIKQMYPLFHGSTQKETIKGIVHNLPYTSKSKFIVHLHKIKGGAYYNRYKSQLSPESSTVSSIRDLIVANVTEQLLSKLNDVMVEIFSRVYYIEPIRATAERYYREQDLSVDEIDSKGHNLPMFLKSLNGHEKDSFKNWTLENLGVEIKAKRDGGHIAILITEEESSNEYNLSDTGFGFSQILPIAAQLWALAERPKSRQRNIPIILSIEQPELHLHPAHQAKIADMLIASIKAAHTANVDVKIIIETHSESIINRLGELSEKFNCNDLINIVVFEKDINGSTSTYEANYDDDGNLVNWPYGFFMP